MKISCDACGAKYTIADAKVQGRKVKVRCKSCKATILVDGSSDAGGEPADALSAVSEPVPVARAAPGPPRSDTWSVNLSDDDSRDMTTADLIAGWKSGLVTPDAYAWKDGMGDWKPVLEIPELKQKLLAAKPVKADAVVSSAKVAPAPAARRPTAASDDLFGAVDFAGSEAEAAAPMGLPGGGHKSPAAAGARNESSVLFSLDALTGGGPIRPVGGGSTDIFGGMSSGGTLGSNTDLLTAPAKEPPPAAMRPQQQAVLMPVQPARKSSMPIALAILGAALIIGGALFFMNGDDKPAEPNPEAATMAAELEKAKAELEKSKADEATAKQAAEDAKRKAEDEAKKVAASAGTTPATPGKGEPAAAAAPSGSSSASSSGSTSKPVAAPAPAAASNAAFDIGAAKAALSAAAANAASCAKPGGPTGSGKVEVTFAPSGRVTSANVTSGPFGGTSVGGCVASKFRGARVPAFSGSPKTVAKGFSVK